MLLEPHGHLLDDLVERDARRRRAPFAVGRGLFGTHPVDRPAMRDRKDPAGRRAARCVEAGSAAPDLDERLLGNLLRDRRIADHAPDEAVDAGCDGVVQGRERVAVAIGDPTHEVVDVGRDHDVLRHPPRLSRHRRPRCRQSRHTRCSEPRSARTGRAIAGTSAGSRNHPIAAQLRIPGNRRSGDRRIGAICDERFDGWGDAARAADGVPAGPDRPGSGVAGRHAGVHRRTAPGRLRRAVRPDRPAPLPPRRRRPGVQRRRGRARLHVRPAACVRRRPHRRGRQRHPQAARGQLGPRSGRHAAIAGPQAAVGRVLVLPRPFDDRVRAGVAALGRGEGAGRAGRGRATRRCTRSPG